MYRGRTACVIQSGFTVLNANICKHSYSQVSLSGASKTTQRIDATETNTPRLGFMWVHVPRTLCE